MFINKIRVFEQSCKRLFIPVLMCYISLIVVDTSEINVGWVVTYSNSFWSFARDAFKIANDKRHQIRAHLHALLKVIRAKFDRVIALKQTAKSNLNITPQLHIKDVTQTKGGKFDSRTKCSTLPGGRVLLCILNRGMLPSSLNPDPSSNKKMLFMLFTMQVFITSP